ncbi:MAG: hypothetical protein BGO61_10930 [Thiobacillus sp. 65-69]|nr:OmpA family protein [Thiobacillus sp.]ODU91131.1 MAG: hypothetical protein ABT21_03765 [Thiobacillus sp. SCN 65-179]OJW38033.1 MAG: hypothetical protein BGO61_10930 [Thiobacillus sp. 65-69]
MHMTPFLKSLAAAGLMLGAFNVQAESRFYDPANSASPTGKTVGYELYRTIGCPGRELLATPCKPTDSDGDGVYDDRDKCPGTPAGRKVNADGCEIDSDGDGIVDGADACPDVPAKTANGCPAPAPAPVVMPAPAPAPVAAPSAFVPPPLVLGGVTFDNDQATLRPGATVVLDQAVAVLQQWGNVKVEVAGHTDSLSDDAHNMKLSQRRAETVRDYLVSRGIAADRLTAQGYGESRPVADNATEAGRAQNRRVELVPQR